MISQSDYASLLSPYPLFDRAFYASQNQSLSDTDHVIQHYLTKGWQAMKSPHPLFSVRFYLETNADVAAAGVEPLNHFVTNGAKEGRNPHPLFDVGYYASQTAAYLAGAIDPLSHYLIVGWRQGYRPIKAFDPRWYLDRYPDVKAAGVEPLTHYLRSGWREGRRPTADFDGDAYRQANGLGADVEPFSHHMRHARGRAGATIANAIDLSDWKMDIPALASGLTASERPLGILVHVYYDGLADELAGCLARIDVPKTIYISTDSEQKKASILRSFGLYGLHDDIQVAVVRNAGFDIAPMLIAFGDVLSRHDIFLKIHGKRSLHNSPEFGERWRAYLYRELVGDAQRVRAIMATFAANPTLGFLAPHHWPPLIDWIGIGTNFEPMENLLLRIGVGLDPQQTIDYPSGSMFWFRAEALRPLFDLKFGWPDFDHPVDQRDATLAHAIERAFFFFGATAGLAWANLPSDADKLKKPRDEALRLIDESGVFDRDYYRRANPDVPNDPLEHWYDYGWKEGRQPSASFDQKYYRRVARLDQDTNPLLHYIVFGRARHLPTSRPARVEATIRTDDLYASYIRAERTPDYVGETFPLIRHSDVKLLAFYFPQFHPFAENDRFWGRGFTEWTNTTKAVPMFKGHYQPRLPGELGFYDTRLKEVLARQIELAKQYGIHGFCLHHYFFEGKPIMRAPYDLLLANPDLDIPFCLHWANEPWTVRWDGLATAKGMLLDQRHNPEDDIAFFRDIEPAVTDPRYITVEGRPLLVVYRPALFPDMKATIERWRTCFHRSGLKEPYLALMQTGFEGAVDPHRYGFDAAIEYPPHNLGAGDVTDRVQLHDPGFMGTVYDYEQTLERALARPKPSYRQFRGIMPEWDCTPRRTNPDLFINCAPHRYQRWLEGICQETDDDRPRDEKLIFINAWNEWAEGAYLEPDRKFGYAYLDAGARALNHYRPPGIDRFNLRILVGAHIFYTDLLDEFVDRFKNVPGRYDLLVTTPIEQQAAVTAYLERELSTIVGSVTVIGVENVGRDFAPFLLHYLPIAARYDLSCWVHSKKSPYDKGYVNWRRYLLGNLLGSPENVQAIVEAFVDDTGLGLLYPRAFPAVAGKMEWGSNFELTRALLSRLGIIVQEGEQPVFPTAAMFWFRPHALTPLLSLGLTLDDFARHAEGPRDPATNFIVDGTISHALERMLLSVSTAAGFTSREMQFEA